MTFAGDVDDDESDVTRDRDWSDYWRLLFKKVSVDDIKTFKRLQRYIVAVTRWFQNVT